MIYSLLVAKDSEVKPTTDQLKQYSSQPSHLFASWDQLLLKNTVLYRHLVSADGTQDHLPLVPKYLWEKILKQIHDGGHLDQEKTLSRVRQKFYWPGHYSDINNCVTCTTHKSNPSKQKAALQTNQTEYPLQMVAVHILRPLPGSEAGNSY